MESKKIKKLEKVNRNSSVRFKKSQLKPSRVPVGQIDRPPRLSDDSEVHLLESVSLFPFVLLISSFICCKKKDFVNGF